MYTSPVISTVSILDRNKRKSENFQAKLLGITWRNIWHIIVAVSFILTELQAAGPPPLT